MVLLVLSLHYLLNPSESGSSQFIATIVRIAAGAVVLLLLFIRFRPPSGLLWLVPALTALGGWLALQNFPNNIELVLLFLAFATYAFVIAAYLRSRAAGDVLQRALDILLAFWIAAFLIQLLVYVVTGTIYDFHAWLHPWSAARLPTAGDDNYVRFTGLMIEPGTFSNWVYSLIVLRGVSGRRLFDKLAIVGVLSTLLTLSAWSVLAAPLYFFALAASNFRPRSASFYRKALVVAVIFGSGTAILWSVYGQEVENLRDYYQYRADSESRAGSAKVLAFEGFAQVVPEVIFFGKPLSYSFCGGCVSPQDAGISLNLVVKFGAAVTAIVFSIIAACIARRYGLFVVSVLGPFAFAKLFYFDPLFWIVVGCCASDLFSRTRDSPPVTRETLDVAGALK
jgi:hypothetical protein